MKRRDTEPFSEQLAFLTILKLGWERFNILSSKFICFVFVQFFEESKTY